MAAAAELRRNPVSKHQIQPEYGDYITNYYMHHKLHCIGNIIIFLAVSYQVANTARGLLNWGKKKKSARSKKRKENSRDTPTCQGATQVSVRLASVEEFLRLIG